MKVAVPRKKQLSLIKKILNRKSGLIKILIDEIIFEHRFQIYVDKNGQIRGYEKSDLILSFSDFEANDLSKENLVTKSKRKYHRIYISLNEEIFFKFIRSFILNIPIILVTEDNEFTRICKDFFSSVFKNIYSKKFRIVNYEEYNHIRPDLILYEDLNKYFIALVDQLTIDFEPEYFGKFKNYTLENYIHNQIPPNLTDDFLAVSIFRKNIEKLLNMVEKVFQEKKITVEKTKKELGKIDKNLKTTDNHFLYHLYKNGYNIDLKKEKISNFFL
jgi:hypothetical protein